MMPSTEGGCMFTVQPQTRVASPERYSQSVEELFGAGGRRVYSLADGTDGVDGVLT